MIDLERIPAPQPSRGAALFCKLAMASLAATCLLATPSGLAVDGPMGVERVARLTTGGYESRPTASDDAVRWVQVDLGRSIPIQIVKLFPVVDWSPHSQNFPARFRIEASEDAAFTHPVIIADRTAADYPDPTDEVAVFPAHGISGRYVRVTATRLRGKKLALYRLEIWSDGRNVAVGCKVSDAENPNITNTALTRRPRPQGEEVVTDNPANVIPVRKWKPVAYQARTPLSGVRLDDGLFKTTMENNVKYLLNSFTVDQLLRQFRDRAGKPNPSGMPAPDPFWETALAGSNAGRFLMGAGNTLRWMDNPELRKRMTQVINGIEDCREPDGYIMAYPPDTIFYSERAAYTRAWLTRGLIAAGFGGDPKAFTLLRGYYDWFDTCPYLPELLRRAGQGVQGMIANTLMYFTPVGKPEDLQVIQRYFQEDYWLNELANHEKRAIWQYPYDHPHCYLLTSIEPYFDLYRATGAKLYLKAAQGGWDLYHDNWEHVGGSIAICEGDTYPPKSYYLHRHTGELCGSVFWVKLNQRFHLLRPDQGKYVAEIEKSIYNVGLANQDGSKGIRYHANLAGHKDPSTAKNTCCEGQGTRLYGSLPEYIYSIADDGIYVDLYAGSTITWNHSGHSIRAHMMTQFPLSPGVQIRLSAAQPDRFRMHLRVPGWAVKTMPILVNGKSLTAGKPGTYAVLDREWKDGDTISFTLPMDFKLSKYRGMEQTATEDRYALEYGPILLALVNMDNDNQEARLALDPQDLRRKLMPVEGRPLHFKITGDVRHEYIPYYEVADQVFTCYPFVGIAGHEKPEQVQPDDLALARKGATATSDSEYAREPGCTSKAIDGIIASPGDFSNRWHSSLESPHPHWIQVKLPKPARIGRVFIHFADPAGYPTSFQGLVRVKGREEVVFDVKNYDDWRGYSWTIKPVTTDTFRLVIRASANPAYPNAAQVSEIELCPPVHKRVDQRNARRALRIRIRKLGSTPASGVAGRASRPVLCRLIPSGSFDSPTHAKFSARARKTARRRGALRNSIWVSEINGAPDGPFCPRAL